MSAYCFMWKALQRLCWPAKYFLSLSGINYINPSKSLKIERIKQKKKNKGKTKHFCCAAAWITRPSVYFLDVTGSTPSGLPSHVTFMKPPFGRQHRVRVHNITRITCLRGFTLYNSLYLWDGHLTYTPLEELSTYRKKDGNNNALHKRRPATWYFFFRFLFFIFPSCYITLL